MLMEYTFGNRINGLLFVLRSTGRGIYDEEYEQCAQGHRILSDFYFIIANKSSVTIYRVR